MLLRSGLHFHCPNPGLSHHRTPVKPRKPPSNWGPGLTGLLSPNPMPHYSQELLNRVPFMSLAYQTFVGHSELVYEVETSRSGLQAPWRDP